MKNILQMGILALLALGFFSFSAFAETPEVVAPYPYSNIKGTDPELLLEKHERLLLRRLKRNQNSGLDLAILANVYASQSQLTGDLTLMDKAEATAKKSLEILPFYNDGSKMVLIQVDEARHHFQDAIKSAAALLTVNKGNSGLLATLVTTSLGNGKTLEAMTYAEELLRFAPYMDSYILRGLAYLGQGKNDLGLADFNKAISMEGPDQRVTSTWIRTLMGRLYYRIGQMDLAMKYTESALIILPSSHEALAQKADIQVALGNVEQADANYIKAFQNRREPPYLLARANLKEETGDLKGAEKLRMEAEELVRTEINTTLYGHYNELAQILIDRGDPGQKEEAIEAAKKNNEQRMTSESYFLLAQAYLNGERFAEAGTAIQMAIQFQESNCEYNYLAVKIQLRSAGVHTAPDNSSCPQGR